ncbi:15729_t:CDS:2, partial [Gigaspora rosea]
LLDGRVFDTEALLDSGASACFLDSTLAAQVHIPTIELNPLLFVEVVDVREISSGLITRKIEPLTLIFQNYTESLQFNFISSPQNLIILVHQPLKDGSRDAVDCANIGCEKIFLARVFLAAPLKAPDI